MHPACRIACIIPCWLAAASLLSSCDKARDALAELASKADKSRAAHGEWVKDISAGEFDSFRQQNDKVVIIDFHAPWCGPCRQLGPLLDEIAAGHEGMVVVGKINVDEHKQFAAGEGVRGIPDLRIYRNGGMVDKLVGLPPRDELRQRINTQVEALRATATASGEPAGDEAPGQQPKIQPMAGDWLPPGIERR